MATIPTLPDDIHAKVLVRSWRDPKFRALIKQDPREGLKELGYEIPDGLKVVVNDAQPGVLNLEVAENPAGESVSVNASDEPSTAGFICWVESFSAHCTKTIQYCSKTVC